MIPFLWDWWTVAIRGLLWTPASQPSSVSLKKTNWELLESHQPCRFSQLGLTHVTFQSLNNPNHFNGKDCRGCILLVVTVLWEKEHSVCVTFFLFPLPNFDGIEKNKIFSSVSFFFSSSLRHSDDAETTPSGFGWAVFFENYSASFYTK